MNKLIARIVAVIMAIAMLGTVSFAASYSEGVITTGKDADASQATETVLAFATNTANATAPSEDDVIIAIEQAADVPATINIDADKIAGKDYIAIVFSGTAGTPSYAYIDNRAKDVTATAITINDYTYTADDGTVYSNVAKATYSFNADADRTVVEYGFRFVKDGGSGEGAELKQTVNATMSGDVSFSAAIVGVPEGTTLIATPYIKYQ